MLVIDFDSFVFVARTSSFPFSFDFWRFCSRLSSFSWCRLLFDCWSAILNSILLVKIYENDRISIKIKMNVLRGFFFKLKKMSDVFLGGKVNYLLWFWICNDILKWILFAVVYWRGDLLCLTISTKRWRLRSLLIYNYVKYEEI